MLLREIESRVGLWFRFDAFICVRGGRGSERTVKDCGFACEMFLLALLQLSPCLCRLKFKDSWVSAPC